MKLSVFFTLSQFLFKKGLPKTVFIGIMLISINNKMTNGLSEKSFRQ